MGFEPTTPISQGKRLAGARTRPLCDPSAVLQYDTINTRFHSIELSVIASLISIVANVILAESSVTGGNREEAELQISEAAKNLGWCVLLLWRPDNR